MPTDGSVDGVTTVNTAISGSSNKRKRVTKDDDEVPKAKRGAKGKKEVKAKAEPKKGSKIEDDYEDLEENGETVDDNGEIDQINEEDLDEEEGVAI